MASTKVLLMMMIVSVLLDLSAIALSVAAEFYRNTTPIVTQDANFNYNYCVYGSNIATFYGIGAALLIMASQIVKMVSTPCFCTSKALNLSGSRAWPSFLIITCWVTFLAAEACLLLGSVSNSERTKYRTIFGDDPPSCSTSKKGVFAAAAILILIMNTASNKTYVYYVRSMASLELEVSDANDVEELKKSLLLEP